MNLTVKGKNLDAGNALCGHIGDSLDGIFSKHFSHAIEATVTLSKQVHLLTAQYAVSARDMGDDVDYALAADSAPAIIAKREAEIPSLTMSEAVTRLDLSDQKATMFRGGSRGGLNVLYQRNDGNIGWVDPGMKSVVTAPHS